MHVMHAYSIVPISCCVDYLSRPKVIFLAENCKYSVLLLSFYTVLHHGLVSVEDCFPGVYYTSCTGEWTSRSWDL